MLWHSNNDKTPDRHDSTKWSSEGKVFQVQGRRRVHKYLLWACNKTNEAINEKQPVRLLNKILNWHKLFLICIKVYQKYLRVLSGISSEACLTFSLFYISENLGGVYLVSLKEIIEIA